MEESAKSMEAIELRTRVTRYPIQPNEDDQDEFADYVEMGLNIRKKRDEITSVFQTLNYVL
eukprot:2249730-Amphidinium_carterae.1